MKFAVDALDSAAHWRRYSQNGASTVRLAAVNLRDEAKRSEGRDANEAGLEGAARLNGPLDQRLSRRV